MRCQSHVGNYELETQRECLLTALQYTLKGSDIFWSTSHWLFIQQILKRVCCVWGTVVGTRTTIVIRTIQTPAQPLQSSYSNWQDRNLNLRAEKTCCIPTRICSNVLFIARCDITVICRMLLLQVWLWWWRCRKTWAGEEGALALICGWLSPVEKQKQS